MTKLPRLNLPVAFRRSDIAFASKKDLRVDREGGDNKSGIIRGAAVITRGEALGHYMWVDAVMLQQTVDAINASGSKGIKARFTHPGLSSDGLGSFLGRYKNAALDGDVVRADIHLSKSAHNTPDGDLASYLMDRAEEDPESFGNSIVFKADFKAEEEFETANTKEVEETDSQGKKHKRLRFRSPDPKNSDHLPHARIKILRAVDAVDSPAANPDGLFHASPIAHEATNLMSYALGLSSERPALSQFDVDPDRLSGFVTRFLQQHGLEVHRKDQIMPKTGNTQQAEGTVEPVEKTYTAGDLKRFRDAFGDQGTDWLLAGKSFEEAEKLHAAAQITKLGADIEALKKASSEQLAAVTKERDELQAKFAALSLGGEKDPVSFGGAESSPKSDKPVGTLPTGLQRFASAIKFAKN